MGLDTIVKILVLCHHTLERQELRTVFVCWFLRSFRGIRCSALLLEYCILEAFERVGVVCVISVLRITALRVIRDKLVDHVSLTAVILNFVIIIDIVLIVDIIIFI